MIVHLANPYFIEYKQFDYIVTNNEGLIRDRFQTKYDVEATQDEVEARTIEIFNAIKNQNWDLDMLIIDYPDNQVIINYGNI
jgi:hypothetical protein